MEILSVHLSPIELMSRLVFTLLLSIFFLLKTIPAGKLPYHALLTLDISQDGLDFLTENIQKELVVRLGLLEIPDQKLNPIGFDIFVKNIKIYRFFPPRISIGLNPPSTINVTIEGGDFEVCVDWKANPLKISTGGKICVMKEIGKKINAVVVFNAQEKNATQSKAPVAVTKCSLKTPLDTNFKGGLWTTVNALRIFLESFAEGKFSTLICNIIKEQVQLLVQQVQFNVTEQYGIQYEFRSVGVSEDTLSVKLAANFSSLM